MRRTRKVKFGEIIGHGDSYMVFVICDCKVFSLRAIPRNAAGAVRSHTDS